MKGGLSGVDGIGGIFVGGEFVDQCEDCGDIGFCSKADGCFVGGGGRGMGRGSHYCAFGCRGFGEGCRDFLMCDG